MEISSGPFVQGDQIYEPANGFTSKVAHLANCNIQGLIHEFYPSNTESEYEDEGVFECIYENEMEFESQWIDVIH